MNFYKTRLSFLALHKFLEKHGYVIIDALCARSFDYVAINPRGELSFIYLDGQDYIFHGNQIREEITSWFVENPAYKSSYVYETFKCEIKSENKARIYKIGNWK